jgi:hypothetical protein
MEKETCKQELMRHLDISDPLDLSVEDLGQRVSLAFDVLDERTLRRLFVRMAWKILRGSR